MANLLVVKKLDGENRSLLFARQLPERGRVANRPPDFSSGVISHNRPAETHLLLTASPQCLEEIR